MTQNHLPCDSPSCSSSDGMSRYDDGHTYCFVCRTRSNGNNEYTNNDVTKGNRSMPTTANVELSKGLSMGFRDRNISTVTCKKFGVTGVGTATNVQKHIYPYMDTKGNHIANKIRILPKSFTSEGSMSNSVALFGQDKFPAGAGKAITIYEGELDAMAGYQLTGSLFPCVSLPSGASSAVSAIKHNLEYLESFEKVVLCFDNDEAGKAAVANVVPLFAIGKVRVMKLELKDACDYLIENKSKEFTKAWHQSSVWTPEDIVSFDDMYQRLLNKKKVESITYPWEGLTDMTYGIRKGELTMFTAKTGIGKTQFLREIAYHIHTIKPDVKIGTLYLEEQPEESAEGLMSVHASTPFHLPDTKYTEVEYREAFTEVKSKGKFFFYENFAESNIDRIINRIRYYVKSLDCEYIILDHLSIIVSGQSNVDDRSALDEITTKIKALTVELNVAIIAVVHLNRQGQIRGSAGIEQLSNTVIHLERDVNHKDPKLRNITEVSVWKNRFAGKTGIACYLEYEPKTNRIFEVPTPVEVDEFEKYNKGMPKIPDKTS